MKRQTSEMILEYLRDHPPATAAELSGALLLTKAAVRYHLNKLLRLGLANKHVKQLVPGAGRPGYYFTPSSKSGYTLISEVLMDQLFSNAAESEVKQFVSNLSSRLLANFNGMDSNGAQRIGLAVQYLSALGYQSTWEARPAHPIVFLKNCPYMELAIHHPILCRMDSALIEKLTGWACTNTQRLRDDVRYIPFCMFSLTPHT
jgi:predicted ArsR family transcriptional regulator